MARPPLSPQALAERFGPHRSYAPPGGWPEQAARPADRLVKTHCCFCGQQCGIQLKVRDNQVVGFEPWEEFPFNRGMLCPKGVKRYLQNGHPDRLKAPLRRTEAGFEEVSWDDALGFTARRLREIQERYGKDAVAIYGGASLTSEKSYLLGKFARVALGTRHIDYNGRLCMVSAGTAYKMAFGVDRCPNPWSDIPKAQVVLVTGANVAECAPITTDYLWRMRDDGGKAHRHRSAHDPDHSQRRPLPARPPRHRRRPPHGHAARRLARRARGPRVHRGTYERVRGGGRVGAGLGPEADRRSHRGAARGH